MKSKTDPRHEARKIALASGFCWLFSDADENECKLFSCDMLACESADLSLTDELIKGMKEHRDEIDALVQECAPDWPLNKVAKVDLIIIRLAIYEMLYSKKAPEKVIIDEAVELAKEFGNDTSSKFVNGVLGNVAERNKKHE